MFNDFACEAPKAMEKKSVNEIFNEMNYKEEIYEIQHTDANTKTDEKVSNNEMKVLNDLKMLGIQKEPKSFNCAVEAAVAAQKEWKNFSALKKATSLHNIWKVLKVKSSELSKLNKEALILLDYFDFYSDLSIQIDEYKSWTPQGVVLVVLTKYSPFLVLSATVPAALGAGCSVIVLAPGKAQVIALFLEEVIAKSGLPEGLFNVVADFDEDNIPAYDKVNKVFFCGSYLSAQKFYAKNLSWSFNFFCPNNTAALILESCDLNAAVDKIVQTTWGENSLFAVSTIVVQESIYKNFFKQLKYRIEQFMIENKNSPIFRDLVTSEKINFIILQALNAGALVDVSLQEKSWSPTVIVNYQNQNIDEDVPLLKVLLCRTPKEGINLINNCQFNLGVSIWSEISSQALEISNKLVCPNIWINCHGVFQASEPLQLTSISGDCVLGGSDGILEYISFTVEEPSEAKIKEDKVFNIDKPKVLQIAESAKNAFIFWQNTTRGPYMKIIAEAMNEKELVKFSEIVYTYAHLSNIFSLSESNSTKEFLVLKKKLPIGVILLILNTTEIDATTLISLITFPIVMGNAVIIILRDENSFVKSLVNHYNKFLPKNILSTIIGIKAGIYLASDPSIQSIWLFGKTETSKEYLKTIRSHCFKSLKRIWIVPVNLSVSRNFFQKECLQNKVVWLTAVDQLP